MPPNTIAPSRPLPRDRASVHCTAGLRYQRLKRTFRGRGFALEFSSELRRGTIGLQNQRAGNGFDGASGAGLELPIAKHAVKGGGISRWRHVARHLGQ